MVRAELQQRLTQKERLTDQQQAAVTVRDVSVALSAGAGCGKTHVLTERFLSHLDRGSNGAADAQLHQLVAITFTERAAREMRDRIRRHCHRRLQTAEPGNVGYWLERLREIDGARISTIHSFCASLLRTHAVEAGIDPHFAVLDQTQSGTLLRTVLDDELRTLLANRDPLVLETVARFGVEGTRNRIAELFRSRGEIVFEEWASTTAEQLVLRWREFQTREAVPAALRRFVESSNTRGLLDLLEHHSPAHPAMQKRCGTLRERLPRLPGSDRPEPDLQELHEAAKVQGGGGKSVWPDASVYDEVLDRFKRLRDSIKKQLLPLMSPIADSARTNAAIGLDLLELTHRIAQTYAKRKDEIASVDFDDLLIRARDLLIDPEHGELRARLASQLRLLLIDEFQDTNRLQVDLLSALCGDDLLSGKLFIVGDYKQSIYRFRGAEPSLFHELRIRIPPVGRLPLTLNFRSQPALLDFVNALFCEALGDGYEPLRAHRESLSAAPCVELLSGSSNGEPRALVAERREREADLIARRIRAMLDAGEALVQDTDAPEEEQPIARPVRQGDITLLFRALSGVEHYEAALRRYGIDYYLVGGHAFYMQQEVYDLANLLRCLVSRCDDVSLLGVLRSPMFSLCDETLYWLAQHPRGLSTALFSDWRPAALDDRQRQRVDFAAETLGDLRRRKDRLGVADLIKYALDRTGYDAVLLAEFLGERKVANLHKLIDLARSFDRSGAFTLSGFTTQLTEFVAGQPPEALAATQHETADVVRLMTIHQAKGLEFPIVVVPEIDLGTHGSSSSAKFDSRLGPLVRLPDDDPDRALAGYELYTPYEAADDERELIRLFYVATTRSADYLILSSAGDPNSSKSGPWLQLLAERFDLASGRLRASLPAGYPVPKLKVTRDVPNAGANTGEQRRGVKLLETIQAAEDQAAAGDGRTLRFIQPVAPDRAARRHYSFSRLSGQLHSARPTSPDAVEEIAGGAARIDPLELGTLVHAVLADIHFGEPVILSQLVRRHAEMMLTKPPPEMIEEAKSLVSRFLESPRAEALAQSAELHAELEFLLAWPPGAEESSPKYLQGFIDCLYRDGAGAWHLLDYKTDRIEAAAVAEAAAQYEMQLFVYAMAIERSLGGPPATLTLHFLRSGVEHRFELTGPHRRRLVEQVNRAIETAEAPETAVARL